MQINNIISRRKFETWPSYDLVFEWENEMASAFGVQFSFQNKILLKKLIDKLPFSSLFLTSKTSFMFQMKLIRGRSFNKSNIIPNIVDFYAKSPAELSQFYKSYSKAPIVFISSLEVFEYLRTVNCPLNICHLALSIPDKYAINSTTTFQKKYDLVLMGRQNPVLEEFLKEYVIKHPDFLYVFRKMENKDFKYYTSEGECIGNINTREEYINLMRAAKIGLYSTPGIDGGEKRTNGFNQVTPRFLEYIACGCHVIARYPKNADTEYYNVPLFAPSIDNYEQFEIQMNYARNNNVDMKKYSDYLAKHYTSVRARQLQEIIKDL